MPKGDNVKGQPKPAAKSTGRATKRRAVRWDYEGSALSLEDIERKHGVGRDTFLEWAKLEGWARRQTRGGAGAPTKADSPPTLPRHDEPNEVAMLPDLTLPEIARKTAFDVILSHRRELAMARALAHQLMAELHVQAAMADHMLAIQQLLTEGMSDPKALNAMRDAVEKILSVPARSTALKNVLDTVAKIQVCERMALGLKDGDIPTPVPADGEVEESDRVEFIYSQRPPPAVERVA